MLPEYLRCQSASKVLFQRYLERSLRRQRNPETTPSFLNRHRNTPGRSAPTVPRLFRPVIPRPAPLAPQSVPMTPTPERPAGSASRARSHSRTDIARRPLRCGPRTHGRPRRVHPLRPARQGPAMLAGITSRPPPARPPSRHAHRPLACVRRARCPSRTPCTRSSRCTRWCWRRAVRSSRACRPARARAPRGPERDAPRPPADSPSSTPSCAPTTSPPCSQHSSPCPAFLSSGRNNSEELTHPTLLATLASPPALHALAAHLCATSFSNLAALIRHAGYVKELW
ncbi:hypothetical protein DFH09DRAFT_1459311 [Mycena vulgaris]|nr:hypothetical protein DFH09DRAFT_1459311 [Mycena vulgaris]